MTGKLYLGWLETNQGFMQNLDFFVRGREEGGCGVILVTWQTWRERGWGVHMGDFRGLWGGGGEEEGDV